MAVGKTEKQMVQLVLRYMGITDWSIVFDCDEKVLRASYKQHGEDKSRTIPFSDFEKMFAARTDGPVSSPGTPVVACSGAER